MGAPDRILGEQAQSYLFYFDNDQAGYAPADALRLREMLFGSSLERAS